MLRLALECCKTTENADLITKAAMAALEGAIGNFPNDIAGQRRAWKKPAVQEEFGKQSALIEAIGALTIFDDQAIAKLRRDFVRTKPVDRKLRSRSPKKNKRVDDDSIDGWRIFVSKHLARSGAHRIAFVACLAERLLPFYNSYATKTGKGQPELLREALDAVRQSAKGRSFASVVLQDLKTKVDQATVAGQDSEGWNAWSAWLTVQLALAACSSVENAALAEEAAVVAYERVAGPGARNDPNAWKDQHRRPEVSNEIMKEMMVLTRLRAMVTLDEEGVEALRTRL